MWCVICGMVIGIENVDIFVNFLVKSEMKSEINNKEKIWSY
jgi:hypothetical protein